MTNTKTRAEVIAPPLDYPDYPGDGWAPADDDYYHVPTELREHYRRAEPSPIEREGFMQFGIEITENRDYEIERIVDPGDATRAPRTVVETITHPELVPLRGASGYRRWLHLTRLGQAQQAKRRDDFRKLMESRWLVCPVCHTRAVAVRSDAVRHAGSSLTVTGCTEHLPVLEETARVELMARAADRTLPDGRRVGDVAAEVITAALAEATA